MAVRTRDHLLLLNLARVGSEMLPQIVLPVKLLVANLTEERDLLPTIATFLRYMSLQVVFPGEPSLAFQTLERLVLLIMLPHVLNEFLFRSERVKTIEALVIVALVVLYATVALHVFLASEEEIAFGALYVPDLMGCV